MSAVFVLSVELQTNLREDYAKFYNHGEVALTPEPVPLCTIVQFRVVLIHVIRKIYYSALSLCIHRFQSTSVVHLGLSQGRQQLENPS